MEMTLRHIEWELNGALMSRPGRHAASSVSKGVTVNTGPGIMAIQAAGHTSVSPCRMLALESTTITLLQGKETVEKVRIQYLGINI